MPYKSPKQKKFLMVKKPEVARLFQEHIKKKRKEKQRESARLKARKAKGSL